MNLFLSSVPQDMCACVLSEHYKGTTTILLKRATDTQQENLNCHFVILFNSTFRVGVCREHRLGRQPPTACILPRAGLPHGRWGRACGYRGPKLRQQLRPSRRPAGLESPREGFLTPPQRHSMRLLLSAPPILYLIRLSNKVRKER